MWLPNFLSNSQTMGVKSSLPEQMLPYVIAEFSQKSPMDPQDAQHMSSKSLGIDSQLLSQMLGMTDVTCSPDIA